MHVLVKSFVKNFEDYYQSCLLFLNLSHRTIILYLTFFYPYFMYQWFGLWVNKELWIEIHSLEYIFYARFPDSIMTSCQILSSIVAFMLIVENFWWFKHFLRSIRLIFNRGIRIELQCNKAHHTASYHA